MIPYNKIPFWENRRRVNRLLGFRGTIVAYANHTEKVLGNLELNEDEEAVKMRREINLTLPEVQDIMQAPNISTQIAWTSPPAVGGRMQTVDLLYDFFSLHRYMVSPQFLIDQIDRCVGLYEQDYAKSVRRTFNPFFWIARLFEWIASVPFRFVGILGFDQSRVESSMLGRILKGILQSIVYIAAFLTVLHFLGKLDGFRNWLNRLFIV